MVLPANRRVERIHVVLEKRTRRYVFGGTVGVLVGLALGFVLAGQSAALQNKTPRPGASRRVIARDAQCRARHGRRRQSPRTARTR